MKKERSIITIDGQGNIALPTDTANIWMSEFELVELFGVIAPTVRAGIKAVYKSGVLREYETKRHLHLANGHSVDVYSLDMAVALAFRIESFGEKFVIRCWKRLCTGEKKKHTCSHCHSEVDGAVSTVCMKRTNGNAFRKNIPLFLMN